MTTLNSTSRYLNIIPFYYYSLLALRHEIDDLSDVVLGKMKLSHAELLNLACDPNWETNILDSEPMVGAFLREIHSTPAWVDYGIFIDLKKDDIHTY